MSVKVGDDQNPKEDASDCLNDKTHIRYDIEQIIIKEEHIDGK